MEQIRKSKKNIPKQLLSFIKNNTRSTTGFNLRNILLLTDKYNVDELTKGDVKALKYQNVDENNAWKIKMIKEITDVQLNKLDVENFSKDELEEILSFLCTS